MRSLLVAFGTEHARVYGHAADGEAVETMSVLVKASSPRDQFSFREIAGAYDPGASQPASREMHFGPAHGMREARVVPGRPCGRDRWTAHR